MQYNEIYNICQPVMDWLKEHYPHNHKIIISTNGAELIENGKLIALDKDLKETVFNQEVILSKEQKEEIQKILDINTSEVKNDEIHKLKWQISSLEECNGRLQSKLDTYNKYLLSRATKEAREMIDHNNFSEVRIVTREQWNNREEKTMNISNIQKCQEEYEKLLKESPLQSTINKISRDILEQKNNTMAMEFTRIICDLLKENGIYVKCTEVSREGRTTENFIEKRYGFLFDSMDFSEHDKEFTDKIEELQSEVEKYRKAFEDAKKERDFQICEYQKKIDELEEESDFCFLEEPIKVADLIIHGWKTSWDYKHFEISELRQIAEHLLVYCNANGEVE